MPHRVRFGRGKGESALHGWRHKRVNSFLLRIPDNLLGVRGLRRFDASTAATRGSQRAQAARARREVRRTTLGVCVCARAPVCPSHGAPSHHRRALAPQRLGILDFLQDAADAAHAASASAAAALQRRARSPRVRTASPLDQRPPLSHPRPRSVACSKPVFAGAAVLERRSVRAGALRGVLPRGVREDALQAVQVHGLLVLRCALTAAASRTTANVFAARSDARACRPRRRRSPRARPPRNAAAAHRTAANVFAACSDAQACRPRRASTRPPPTAASAVRDCGGALRRSGPRDERPSTTCVQERSGDRSADAVARFAAVARRAPNQRLRLVC